MVDQAQAIVTYQYAQMGQEQIELIKRTIAKGASDDELALFIQQCNRTGLDPFARQIYSIRRKAWNNDTRQYEENQMTQVSIDGFRLIAERTNHYAGQLGPWWCGKDGEWKEVWLEDVPPAAAKVGVLRHDFLQPTFSVALYKSYVQTNKQGQPVSRWKTDPAGMLAKCAESLALRRAFPQELSGLYTSEEMDQANNMVIEGESKPAPAPAPPSPPARTPEDIIEGMGYDPLPAEEPKPAPKPTPARPYDPETLKRGLHANGSKLHQDHTPDPKNVQYLAAVLNDILGGDDQRHELMKWLWDCDSSKDLDFGQVMAMTQWLKPAYDTNSKSYTYDTTAATEARSAHTHSLKANGQAELPME